MTDTQPSLPAPPPAKAPSSKVAWIALVLALILSCAIFVYFWQANQHLQSQLQASQSNLSQVQMGLNKLQNENSSGAQGLVAKQQSLENGVQKLNQQVQFNAAQLSQLKNGSRLDWLLSESEYLLRLANQRLNLEGDMRGAEMILSAADEVLKEANDPALTAVRKAVASEMLALQSTAQGDLKGTYARLDALIANINELPILATEFQAETDDAPVLANTEDDTVTPALKALLGELKNAIKISRVTEDATPLLAPEQRYYLRQNLRLMLEQAALALLNKDAEAYARSLEKAHTWLQTYYPANKPRVAAYLKNVAQLKGFEFNSELPDISGSLRLLKAEIESMYRSRQLNKLQPEQARPKVKSAPTPSSAKNSPAKDAA